jgi:hypothetical protein
MTTTPSNPVSSCQPNNVQDFIEQLRAWPACEGHDAFSSTYVGQLLSDAADEIERLSGPANDEREQAAALLLSMWKEGHSPRQIVDAVLGIAYTAPEPVAWRVKDKGDRGWLLYYSKPPAEWDCIEPLYTAVSSTDRGGK